jgi:NTE family protein
MRVGAVLGLVAALGTAAAQERPRIGLALGGGGARGAAHIGALQALEELCVPVDAISGTSAGAIVGGLYASGMSPDEIARVILQTDWDEQFRDSPTREGQLFRRKREDVDQLWKLRISFDAGKPVLPSGVVSGQKLGFLFRTLTLPGTPDGQIESLPIPFAVVATDLETGAAVVLDRGDLSLAIRASMAVPGVFAPVEFDRRLLVDGGLADNLPVRAARGLGADRVIAIDVGAALAPRERLRSLLEITDQVTTLMTRGAARRPTTLMGENDLLIEPALGEASSADFAGAAPLIEIGRQAVLQQTDRLRSWALPPAACRAWQEARAQAKRPLPRIESIRIVNSTPIDTRMLTRRLSTKPGASLDIALLQRDLERIYELDRFERIEFQLNPHQSGSELVIQTVPTSIGRSYLKAGLNLTSDLKDTGTFNALASYTRTWLNRRAGEWRTLIAVGNEPRVTSELFQPFDFESRWFFSPRIDYGRRLIDEFEGDQRLRQQRLRSAGLELSFGRQLGHWGEWRVGYRAADLASTARVSSDRFPSISARRFAWTSSLGIDRLDNVNFPRRGLFFNLELDSVRSEIEQERPTRFRKLNMAWLLPLTRGKNTVLLSLDAGSPLGRTTPFFDRYTLGGFYRVSGLRLGQIDASRYLTTRALYYRKIAPLPGALGTGVFAGVGLELTQAQAPEAPDYHDRWIRSGLVFIGADTVIGPLYLAFGATDRDESAGYLYLGRTF